MLFVCVVFGLTINWPVGMDPLCNTLKTIQKCNSVTNVWSSVCVNSLFLWRPQDVVFPFKMFGTYPETLGHLARTMVLELLDDFVVLTQFDPLFTSAKKTHTYTCYTHTHTYTCKYEVNVDGASGVAGRTSLTSSRWSGTYGTTGFACSDWSWCIWWNNSSCAKAYCRTTVRTVAAAYGGRAADAVGATTGAAVRTARVLLTHTHTGRADLGALNNGPRGGHETRKHSEIE